MLTSSSLKNKQKAELLFWKQEMNNYVLWYKNDLPILYNTSAPLPKEQIIGTHLFESAILTWTELHQKPKYLNDLNLTTNQFINKRILDVGSGPIPSTVCFEQSEIYSLDPLMDQYKSIGYPMRNYPTVHFVNASAENIPYDDDFFDVIISLNAIDHVDDLDKT